VSGCARAGPGSRAARHRIRRDDSRVDTAEVEISTTTSCSSSRPRTPGFHLGNAGSNPSHDAINRSPPRDDAPRGLQTGRNDWAAPEPVTGTSMRLSICLVNSVVRVPACLVGSRGFESRTGRQTRVSLAQLDQSAGLRSRRSHVRVVHETPISSRRSQAAEGVWLQPRGRKPASVRI
jgi:hypothetical protein